MKLVLICARLPQQRSFNLHHKPIDRLCFTYQVGVHHITKANEYVPVFTLHITCFFFVLPTCLDLSSCVHSLFVQQRSVADVLLKESLRFILQSKLQQKSNKKNDDLEESEWKLRVLLWCEEFFDTYFKNLNECLKRINLIKIKNSENWIKLQFASTFLRYV